MDKDAQLSGAHLTEPELQGLQRERTAHHAATGSATEQTGRCHLDDDVFVVQLVDDVIAVPAAERSDYGN